VIKLTKPANNKIFFNFTFRRY